MTGVHPRRRDRFAVDRRRFLRLSLTASGAALAPGLLAGCGARAPGGDGLSLKIWDLFSGGDGLLMDEMMDSVRGGPQGFTLDRTILEWGPSYYTKLAMAAAGGRAPDVAVLHLSRMPGYAPGGLLDPFDLELLAEFGVTAEDFPPALWERAQWEGTLYAVPLDTHPFIVFYDLDVAERAGVLDGAGRLIQPGSPGAMLETSAALAEAHGGAGLLFGHVTDPVQNWRIFNALYAQTGATFDLPASGPAIDTDAAVRVVSFL
ncbi:ABC transporter substrate-binding protein, partial [Streptomyces sp. NPDC059853]|uniref:ABC transporter substrate-binding protein n=1 Tax=Streptomyces sp. NPDC059853 TaxID=3346973 RepID=UPI003667511B